MDKLEKEFYDLYFEYLKKNHSFKMFEPVSKEDLRPYVPKKIISVDGSRKLNIEEHRQGTITGSDIFRDKSLLGQSEMSKYARFMEASLKRASNELMIPNPKIIKEFIIILEPYRKQWISCINDSIMYGNSEAVNIKSRMNLLEQSGLFGNEEWVSLFDEYNSVSKLILKESEDLGKIEQEKKKNYISLDFVLLDIGINIETDGSQHNTKISKILDKARDIFIEKYIGLRVLRYYQLGKGNSFNSSSDESSKKKDYDKLLKSIKSNLGRQEFPRSFSQLESSSSYFLGLNLVRKDATWPIVKELIINISISPGDYGRDYLVNLVGDMNRRDGTKIGTTNEIVRDVELIMQEVFNIRVTFKKPLNP